jgi:hypothetical protein
MGWSYIQSTTHQIKEFQLANQQIKEFKVLDEMKQFSYQGCTLGTACNLYCNSSVK